VRDGHASSRYQLCPEILVGAKGWEALWDPIDLFSEFKQFVQITARASTPATMSAFSGLVQSTLRVFVSGFPPDFHAVPFPKVYEVPRASDDAEQPYRRAFFFGISRLPVVDGDRPPTKELEISDFFEHFLSQVARKMLGSPSLHPETCYVEPLQSFRRKNLPLFVFPDGKRPRRKASKRVAGGASSAASKNAATASTTPSVAADATTDAPVGTSASAAAALTEEDRSKRKADEDLEADDVKKQKESSEEAVVESGRPMQIDDELELAAAPLVVPVTVPAVVGAPKLRLATSPLT
jgi:hypothetical protein